jgi:glucosylceramidase
MQQGRLVAVMAAVTLLPIGCHEDSTTGSSGTATMTVSSLGAYGQAGVVRVLGAKAGSPDLTIAETTTYQAIDGFGGGVQRAGLGRARRPRRERAPAGAAPPVRRAGRGTVPVRPAAHRRERLRARSLHPVQPALRLWASAWTPPPWLKTNGAYDGGAMRDDPAALAAYALYLARFVESYRAEGLTVQAVHVQNEPAQLTRYPSCLWTPELVRDFVRDHLGPTFEARQVPAEIWLGTLNTAEPLYASVVLGEAGARRHVRGIGVQWGALAITAELAASYPDLPLMQTETVCGNHPWEPGFDPDRPPNDHAYGELTWGRILAYLRAGVPRTLILSARGDRLELDLPAHGWATVTH